MSDQDRSIDHKAAAGVEDPRLAALLEEHWEAILARYPVWASRQGDRRYDDRLPGTRPEDHEQWRGACRGFLERAREIEPETLGPADAMTLGILIEDLEPSLSVGAFRMEEWSVYPRGNPVVTLGWLPESRPLQNRADGESLLARYRAMSGHVDGEIETLGRGAADGRFANAESVRRTVEMVRGELAKPTSDWAAVTQISLRDGDAAALLEEAALVLEEFVRPALERYASFLEESILPRGRSGSSVGLLALPGGAACYEALVRLFTTLPMTASAVHEVGREALEGIHREFSELGERVFGTGEVERVFHELRTREDLHFETGEQVEAKAASALAAAKEAMPAWFGRLPRADCVVKRIPDHEAPYTTVAYYRPPPADGSGPGEYRINVHAPETRPRHEAEVLAFHESIPGHHLQIAIAQELPEMPAFRRQGGITAYVEGWALYTERLADEMGLYSGDEDRLGMLSFDAWRAARLVVDTGIHAMGWTRGRATSFMLENTPLAPNNIDNEVDRYICWPGQALSYKIGQREFWRLRREAEAALRDAFDIREFHDLVLSAGALPLGMLGDRVREWTASRPR